MRVWEPVENKSEGSGRPSDVKEDSRRLWGTRLELGRVEGPSQAW